MRPRPRNPSLYHMRPRPTPSESVPLPSGPRHPSRGVSPIPSHGLPSPRCLACCPSAVTHLIAPALPLPSRQLCHEVRAPRGSPACAWSRPSSDPCRGACAAAAGARRSQPRIAWQAWRPARAHMSWLTQVASIQDQEGSTGTIRVCDGTAVAACKAQQCGFQGACTCTCTKSTRRLIKARVLSLRRLD